MTPACIATLVVSLALYLAATLLFQGHLLLRRPRWRAWGHRLLLAGLGVHAFGLVMHFTFSGRSPLASMLIVVSMLTVLTLAVALLAERYGGVPHLALLAAPLAFLSLLYTLLMPVHFDAAESLLLRYPWLGVHVALTLLGYIGFSLAFCAAVAYLAQNRSLKRGRLNRYLPPLDASAAATFHFAAVGFSLFSLGLGMGVLWLFGAPGEYLAGRDTKIWMALPIWVVFAGYLYQRTVAGRQGSRLKWLVVVGFVLVLVNLLAVRHQIVSAAESPTTVRMQS